MILAQVCVVQETLPCCNDACHPCSSLFYIFASHTVQESVRRCLDIQVAHSHSGNGRRTRNISSFLQASCIPFFLSLFIHHLMCHIPTPRLCQTILFLIFGRSKVFVSILGFIALGLESTLPVPQLIRYVSVCHVVLLPRVYSNYRQRSLYGFRMSTLIGWVGGDTFKHAHFLYSPIHCIYELVGLSIFSFNILPCNSKSALFSSYLLTLVSLPCLVVFTLLQYECFPAIVAQRILYGNAPSATTLPRDDDELEEALALDA